MKITRAIPASLQKEVLTAEEEDALRQFGDQAMTDEELLQRQADEELHLVTKAAKQKKKHNDAILSQLETIDRKSIRAMREGNEARLEALEQEAALLRADLK